MENFDNISMVVHGPEPFDSGYIHHVIRKIRPETVVVAGVMARTAAEESGIDCQCTGMPPSRIAELKDKTKPAFLLNHAKSQKSGLIFGNIIAERIREETGLIQVECADRSVILWNKGNRAVAEYLSEQLQYQFCKKQSEYSVKPGTREIRGCKPGESVFINGIIIGYADAETVVLSEHEGEVTAVSGLLNKLHGFEKLRRNGPLDITSAWCKSGIIRSKSPAKADIKCKSGNIVIIDHAGCELYQKTGPETCGLLSIGDDTTAVCGHIGSHLGIPVFGVTDGDADTILTPSYPKGSVVIEVINGRDDETGAEIAAGLKADRQYTWSLWVKETLESLKDEIKVVVDTR
ncbi:MAG: DUF2117 domain-containing protein [Euryarchaeota archaeon]|nr:DUF2117 domain-containing protein [Euryarchaeota archaeon]